MPSWRSLVVTVVVCMGIVALAGCVEGDTEAESGAAAPEDRAPDGTGWTTQTEISLNASGAYVIPYYAPTETPLNVTVTMDGGTWRGFRINYVGQDGQAVGPQGQKAIRGDLFNFWERARYVHEERANGVYEIECLGERDNDTCLPYDNPSQVPWRAEPWIEEHLYEDSLPAGHNYILLYAEFATHSFLNLTLGAPAWMGGLLSLAEGQILSPELFRGEVIDMVRCYTIGWCGSLLGGHFAIDQGDRDYALVFFHQNRGVTVYGKSCFEADDMEAYCGDDQPFGPTSVFHNLRFSGKPPPGLELRVDVMGGSSTGWTYNRTFGHSFTMDGAVIWYDLPDQHPGLAAEVIEAEPEASAARPPTSSDSEGGDAGSPGPGLVDLDSRHHLDSKV